MKKILIFFLISVFLFSCATTDMANTSANGEPVPYEDDEFPDGLIKLRRGEVLLFGSLPLFYMFTSMGYDMLVDESYDTNTELAHKMTITVSLSALLALADFIVGEVQENKKAELNDQ